MPGGAGGPVAGVSTFGEWPSVVLSAGEVRATFVPSLGMVGVSLRFRGREFLALPGGLDAAGHGHPTGMPLLHPWANRLGADRYRVGRTTVDLAAVPGLPRDPTGLAIHGTMLGARAWEVLALTADDGSAGLEACYAYPADAAQDAAFPFPHELRVTVVVDPGGLTVTTRVRASGRRSVPVAFGWHPYFRLPGVGRRALVLHLPDRRHLELDGRMVPTGRATREAAEAGPLGGRTFDDGYRLGAVAGRVLGLSGGGHRLEVRLDRGYRYAQVYAPAQERFVALEPMTAPANALVTGEHPTVAPGEEYTATFVVRLGVDRPAR